MTFLVGIKKDTDRLRGRERENKKNTFGGGGGGEVGALEEKEKTMQVLFALCFFYSRLVISLFLF